MRFPSSACLGGARFLSVVALLGAWTAQWAPSLAGAGQFTEYEVKAAFVFNFAKFVQWPARSFVSGEAPLIIGILGEDPFGSILDETVAGRRAQNRPLLVRRYSEVQEVLACHILFISASEEDDLGEVFEALGDAGILTVGDLDRFAERGGMIGLRMEEKKIRFDINVEAAKRGGLKMSSQLLKLASIVHGPQPSRP